MLGDAKAFGSFSVDDVGKAKTFYGQKLGLAVTEHPGMGLMVDLPGGGRFFLYPKEDHRPATFTVLNFSVADIDAAADALATRGVAFERYPGFEHDAKGIVRSDAPEHGPSIAWFKDPAGNILAILESGA